MARYNVLYFCTVCRCIHPTEIYIPLEDGFLKMKTITEAYGGKVLPFHVAMLVGSSVRCQETGKSFVLEDIDQVYLAPVLRKRLQSPYQKPIAGHTNAQALLHNELGK